MNLLWESVKIVYNGLESLSYLGSMVWGKLPVEYKEIEFLLEFQPKLKVGTQITVLAEFEKNAIVMLVTLSFYYFYYNPSAR